MSRIGLWVVVFLLWVGTPGNASVLQERAGMVEAALAETIREMEPGHEHFLLAMDVGSGAVLGSNDEVACRTRLFSPGSVFKLVSAWLLAADRSFSVRQTADCAGRFYLFGGLRSGGRLIHEDAVAAEANDYFKCTKDGGHGRLALQRALAVSCNVFFYTMHGRLPAASLVRTAHRLGLTERCGLSGRGGAEPVHPLPGTHLRRILFPVGHGCQTTPLAAAVFLNAILNDGHVLEPQVLPADGRVARQVRRVVRPLEPFFLLRRAMREAVMTGTAAAAGRELRVPLGGKTGSGIRGNDVFRLDGWFLSYAPAEAPRILLVAVTTGSAGNGLPLANSVRFYRGLEQRGFFSKQR